ncbi:hypothetical protein MVI27_07305 [Chryseobacterium salipaludis]|uniref:hypothetical protein n=1 Tax=Chryseobacterium TaxID=59732 RepID=UPI001FF5AD80|nr:MULTISPECIES: hypothetical protein [Chryseobacterium]MCJ8498064.1 hypothetical protein [Chryseobacterium salipaludis]MCX3296737.1 hypothetical protein [Planobacterium sp. JC490]
MPQAEKAAASCVFISDRNFHIPYSFLIMPQQKSIFVHTHLRHKFTPFFKRKFRNKFLSPLWSPILANTFHGLPASKVDHVSILTILWKNQPAPCNIAPGCVV